MIKGLLLGLVIMALLIPSVGHAYHWRHRHNYSYITPYPYPYVYYRPYHRYYRPYYPYGYYRPYRYGYGY
jgi:hypothetical protein